MRRLKRRARILLRGLPKLAGVVVLAGGIGAGLGLGVFALAGDEGPATAVTPTERSTTSTATPSPPPSTTTSKARNPLEQLDVTVGSAVLHPAATPAFRRRQRARLGVRVRVRNRGSARVVLVRPSLLAARQRVFTNPRADARSTHISSIGPGETINVALRFETAGAATEQLRTQKRAQILFAGRARPVSITVGSPVSSPPRSNAPQP